MRASEWATTRFECSGSLPECHAIAMQHVEDFAVLGGIETDRNSAFGFVSNHCNSL